MLLDPMAIVTQGGVVQHGHFKFTSGGHGDTYVGKITDPKAIEQLSWLLARFSSNDTQVVMGPESGGIPYAKEVAKELSILLGCQVQYVVAKKGAEAGFFLENPSLVQGKAVLVIDDALTTGGSLKAAMQTVRNAGGSILGVMVIWNRGGITHTDLQVPFLHALIDKRLPTYIPGDSCPGCAQGVPLTIT